MNGKKTFGFWYQFNQNKTGSTELLEVRDHLFDGFKQILNIVAVFAAYTTPFASNSSIEVPLVLVSRHVTAKPD